jgi:hypothetical protein
MNGQLMPNLWPNISKSVERILKKVKWNNGWQTVEDKVD